MWEKLFVHGHTVVAEHVENLLDAGRPIGWGRAFTGRAGRACWFHASLPIVGWRRADTGPSTDPTHVARALRIHLEHILDPDVRLDAVHLFDGPRRILVLDDDGAIVEPGLERNSRRMTWEISPTPFSSALGVSILLRFLSQSSATLCAVGATYEVVPD